MRILLDTNIWRYIVDADAVVTVQKAALRSKQRIAIAPAVLHEAARTRDPGLREALLSAMKRPTWQRLMPEAYSEALEFKDEVRRLRPEWLRPVPNLRQFNRLRRDWRACQGGAWSRVDREAELLQRLDAKRIDRAREDAKTLRAYGMRMSDSWQTVSLQKILAKPSASLPGWNGEAFEPWRFVAHDVFHHAIASGAHPYIDWLENEVDLGLMLFQSSSLVSFWLHEAQTLRMRRHWLRWAFEFLQQFRRVTDGTPVDSQVGSYLLDVDIMLSADKNLVRVAERCRNEAPFSMATSRTVPGGSAAVSAVLGALEAT